MNRNRRSDLESSSTRRHRAGDDCRAFTLVELLVVLATVGILAMVLLPALASSTQPASAKAFQCLNNMRQMAVAWTLYAEDNHDRLVNNFGTVATQAEIDNQTYRNWVNDNMTWTLTPALTNLVGIIKAPFNSYLSGNVACYKCPADNFINPILIRAGYGPRPRSYSMNAYCGPYTPTWTATANAFFPSYRQFLKMSGVPNPANIYVMLEEHPDSINDGYFLNNADPNIANWPRQNWNDVPGSNHAGATGVSFADGHSEMHQWKSYKCTILPVKFSPPTLYPFSADSTGFSVQDAQWLALRSSVPK